MKQPNIKADIRVKVELWVDCCKRCMTSYEKQKVRELRDRIDADMKASALRVLRKHKDVEVNFL